MMETVTEQLGNQVLESYGEAYAENCPFNFNKSMSKVMIMHVEICQKASSTMRQNMIKSHVTKLLHQYKFIYGDFTLTEFSDPFLEEHVESVSICDTDFKKHDKQDVDLSNTDLIFHVYQLHNDGPASEELEDENLSAANHWLLPSSDFIGIWENLVFDFDIKTELLNFVTTTALFSDKKVNSNIISWNRVVLLYGPPGTGKTSLCKALAQKLSIRLSDRYKYGQLIEINSHSLFSKWFSESGKLVMKMFHKIQEFIDDPEALVCILIDEVESLTHVRKSSASGSDPSDAIRVVNALLTQIDHIKRYPNVIILTTSNMTQAIDLAFVDRADIKQYIGLPSGEAIYKIYQSCVIELMRVNIIMPTEQILDYRALELSRFVENDATRLSLMLREIALKSEGLSGRTLRKLPFLAHSIFVKRPSINLQEFLVCLAKAIERQFQNKKDFPQ